MGWVGFGCLGFLFLPDARSYFSQESGKDVKQGSEGDCTERMFKMHV